jgi:tetratricopeptide (TPR) repeat protein
MSNNYWLDLSFDLIEEYIPKGIEPYNEGNHIRKRFAEMANHTLTVAELFQSKYHGETEQGRVADIFTNTAFGYNPTADYSTTLTLYKKSLNIIKKLVGSEHQTVSNMCSNIALAYQEQGNYDEAVVWYDKALLICEKLTDIQYPETVSLLNNIAALHQDRSEYEKSAEVLDKALETQETALGKEHPAMEDIYDNIAALYYAQEDYIKARDFFCKAAAVSVINGSSDNLLDNPTVANVYLCYTKCGGKEGEFENWLRERIKTYPS